eukprot:14734282-Heterocapsa_arctica.AAC.1
MYEGKEIIKFITFNKEKIADVNTLHIIGTLAEYMMDKPRIRKPLSKLGALRISIQEAIGIVQSSIVPNNYCIVMVNIEDKGVNKVGHILYQDLGNYAYARWPDQVKAIQGAFYLADEKKADLVEAILGLG